MSAALDQHLKVHDAARLKSNGHVLLHYEKYRNHQPRFISVEGNIGVGKSTFISTIPPRNRISILPEPLEKWRDHAGQNMLHEYYNDPKKYAFAFQSLILQTMLEALDTVPITYDRVITERSLQSSLNVFSQILFSQKHLSAAQLQDLRERVPEHCRPDLYIYLYADSTIIYDRMKARAREEEANVTSAYLREIEHFYNEWLLSSDPGCPVLVLNAARASPVLAQVAANLTQRSIAVPYYL